MAVLFENLFMKSLIFGLYIHTWLKTVKAVTRRTRHNGTEGVSTKNTHKKTRKEQDELHSTKTN
jgi:hypothetical protein